MNAAALVMETTGQNPLKWGAEEWQNLAKDALLEAKPDRLLTVLHAMLAADDPNLTKKDLGDMLVSMEQMKELFSAVALAFKNFMGPLGDAPPQQEADPTKA